MGFEGFWKTDPIFQKYNNCYIFCRERKLLLEWTRGAGGAAGATWGECQRPRISRIGAEPENGPSRRLIRCGTPFFERFFLKTEPYVHRPARKRGWQKKEQTHRHTKSGRSRARPGPCFGQPNVRYQSQNLSKVVPKTSCGSLLRTRLKGTSGFSSVVGTLLKLRLRRNLPRGFILVHSKWFEEISYCGILKLSNSNVQFIRRSQR